MSNDYDNIPDEIKPLKQWVVWRLEEIEKEGEWKQTKIPYKTQTMKAATTRKDEWKTFDEALSLINKHKALPKWSRGCKLSDVGLNGLGFVFTDDDNYVGIDWDHIRNAETGEIETQYINEMKALDTYCEISQSGEGAHAICKGTLPGTKHRKANTPYEMYETMRFFVMTGNHYDETPKKIRESSKESIKAIYDKIDPPKKEKKTASKHTTQRIEDKEILELCQKASNADKFNRLYNGDVGDYGGDHSAADMALCSIIAFYTQDEGQIERIFEGSGLVRGKWNDRKDYRDRTISEAVNGLSEVYTPKKASGDAEISERVKATYSYNGSVWGINITVDGNKALQTIENKNSFEVANVSRETQLKKIVSLLNGKAIKAVGEDNLTKFTKDEIEEIVFDIINKGAALVGKLEVENIERRVEQDKYNKMKEEENTIEQKDIMEDPLEMVIDDEIKERARDKANKIMESGNPIKEVVKVIQEIHVGDGKLSESMCLGLASQSCLNTQGIQTSTVGVSGGGKSHNVKAFIHTVRPKHVMETSLTPKALYYSNRVKDGVIVFSDDVGMDEEMETIIKRATTNYQEVTKHTTVVKQEGSEMSIPPRIMWMLTSVESEGSEQLLNRQITLNVEESKEHKHNIFMKQIEDAEVGEMSILAITENVLVAREIHDNIKNQLFNVAIPFAKKIHIADKTNSRNFPLFLDMLKGYTIYRHMQRDRNESGYLIADREDFNDAKKMFESQQENILTKLNANERKIMQAIGQSHVGATVNEIKNATGIPYANVLRLLNGRKERGTEGLLDRFSDLSFIEHAESIKDGDETTTTHTKKNYYTLRNYDPLKLFDGEYVTLEDE